MLTTRTPMVTVWWHRRTWNYDGVLQTNFFSNGASCPGLRVCMDDRSSATIAALHRVRFAPATKFWRNHPEHAHIAGALFSCILALRANQNQWTVRFLVNIPLNSDGVFRFQVLMAVDHPCVKCLVGGAARTSTCATPLSPKGPFHDLQCNSGNSLPGPPRPPPP